MANPKRPELKVSGSMIENFKNFELRFNDFCIQAEYRDLAKDPEKAAEKAAHYKKPQLEISALRSALPDVALEVLRYTLEPQIANDDKKKPWVWMDMIRQHYINSTGSSRMTDRFKFWTANQKSHESVQDWEVRVRQAGSLCDYAGVGDEMSRDKFVFGLYNEGIRTELLKTHLKADKTEKGMNDVTNEAKTLESAQQANKLIANTARSSEEQVNWTGTRMSHKEMKLKREPGTCHWCGDPRGGHTWSSCPAKGKTCSRCGGYDYFGRVCLEGNTSTPPVRGSRGRGYRGRNYRQAYQPRSQPNQAFTPSPNRQNTASNPSQKLHQLSATGSEERDSQDNQQYYYYTDDSHQTYQISTKNGKRYFVNLPVSATGTKFTTVQLQIDTAATCNTICESVLAESLPEAKLENSRSILTPYGDAPPFRPVGQVELVCERQGKYELLMFQVLPKHMMKGKPALLSGTDSIKLDLVKIRADVVHTINTRQEHDPDDHAADNSLMEEKAACNHVEHIHLNTTPPCKLSPCPSFPITIPADRHLPPPGRLSKEDILQEYADNFKGQGFLGPPVRFKLRDDITPIQMPVHRVPVAKREKEKITLDRYCQEGIMMKVEEPTPWCSNELIKETPKKFRICIDPSQTINKAIMRPIHQMPTLNEQLHKLCNAKCFTLADVKEGFLHCPLDESSSLLTTMHTSYGRYRWLRLPFGITSAPEEFHMRLAIALEGLEGIVCVADDILVYGEGDTYKDAELDHDRRMIALMERCSQKNIKLNPNKLQFKLKEVKFMGNLITDKGMKPDPDKISAITNMPTPVDNAGLLRFIGMINYLSPFCQNLSTVIQPLRALTRHDTEFIWSSSQDKAFAEAKLLISCNPTLLYYDLSKPVTLQVDASEHGLGGALLQPNELGGLQPVAYTSCSLSDTERRYSQIEKECLAICNCFSKFDHWLYGKSDIEVHTDHKPLESIMQKPLNKAPARLQRMMMQLQRYRFKLSYRRGTSLHLADTLSRAALHTPVLAKVTGFDVFRLELADGEEHNPGLTNDTENRLRTETRTDSTLSVLYTVITEGWHEDRNQVPEMLRPYWNYRDELSVQNGIIYKGPQVMIPTAMQQEMLIKIHVNHLGAESNIRMAREVLYWQGMRAAIKDMCDSCQMCAQYGASAKKEPMKSLPIPTLPWQLISQDILVHEGKSYLTTVCHFSDWIELDELADTLATTVISKTKAHFARFGVPKICHTDNGPQYISKEFKDFASEYGFKHTTSSPYYPQGNGRAEAAVKVGKGMLKKADDFDNAMLTYRNTPPQGHSYSPAQRMLSRRTRTLLPTSDLLLNPLMVDNGTVVQEIKGKRSMSKAQYDKTAGPGLESIDIGTHVYAKPPPTKRGKPWAYGKVIAMDSPRSYTLQGPTGAIRRNRVHVRPAVAPPPRPNPTAGQPVGIFPQPTYVPPSPSQGPPLMDTARNTEQGTAPIQAETPTTVSPPTSGGDIQDGTGEASFSATPQRRTRTRVINPPAHLRDYDMSGAK